MQAQVERQLEDQRLFYENKIRQVQTNNSTATLASILATTAVTTEFLSSLSGIGDDVVLKLEDWSTQTKKIWLANLQARGAETVDLETLLLPQIYKFCHNKQPIKVLLHSSFGHFGKLKDMAFFEFLKALFPQTSSAVVDQIPIAAPYNVGYLGEKNQAATILGVEDHLKIMNGLSSIFNGVVTDAIILGFGDAGRHTATLPDILDDSTSAVHPCIAYGSFTGTASTWEANFSYAQIYTKLYVGSVTETQGRNAEKVLQLQGEQQAYTTSLTNVAMIEKQQNAWNSVKPIIDKLRELHQTNPTIRNLCLGCRTRGCANAVADDDTTLCSFCLDERKAIEKGKQLEQEARKLEREAIEKGKELKRETRKLEKDAIAKKKQLERETRNLKKGAYVCGHCNTSFSSKQ